LGLPFDFNIGSVSCCENQACNVPFQALSAQSDNAPIELYLSDDSCYYGKGSTTAQIGHFQWYMSPYSSVNQLLIPTSTIDILGLGNTSFCIAGQAMGYDILTGTTTIKDFSSTGNFIYIWASTSPMCIMPSSPDFCEDPCQGMATSTIGDTIACGFKKSGCWLVLPSNKTKEKFKESTEKLKSAFPFSLFFSSLNDLKTAISTSTDDRSGVLAVPMYDRDTHSYYMITVMSSSSMPNAIGQTNSDLYRNTLIWVFWIVGLFYIIFRLIK
jgi:hypothetical protein